LDDDVSTLEGQNPALASFEAEGDHAMGIHLAAAGAAATLRFET